MPPPSSASGGPRARGRRVRAPARWPGPPARASPRPARSIGSSARGRGRPRSRPGRRAPGSPRPAPGRRASSPRARRGRGRVRAGCGDRPRRSARAPAPANTGRRSPRSRAHRGRARPPRSGTPSRVSARQPRASGGRGATRAPNYTVASSMKRAARACSIRRVDRGSVPYAASRISTCLKVYSTSFATVALGPADHQAAGLERLERVVHVLQLADPVHDVPPERLADDRRVEDRGPRVRRQCVDPGGDRRTDGRGQPLGRGVVPPRRASSSMNSGLPPAVATTRATASARASVSSTATTCAASSDVSGSRTRLVWPVMPAPHAGRASRNSGRASASNTTRWFRTCATRYSMSSSRRRRPSAGPRTRAGAARVRTGARPAAGREQEVDRLIRRLVQAETQQQRQVPRGLVDLGHRQQDPASARAWPAPPRADSSS